MTETIDDKKQRAQTIYEKLEKQYPDAHVLLNYSNPFELLIATILAAQSTDARTNEVTADLFKKYPKPKDFAEAPLETLQEELKPTGFFRQKSKSVKAASQEIVEKHGGNVPDDIETLSDLPGVGRKTASVVVGNAYGKPAVIVDTHVLRVSGRLGLASEHNVKKKYADKVEKELKETVPEKQWTRMSNLLSFHGRNICVARKPKCPKCPVNAECPYPDKTQG